MKTQNKVILLSALLSTVGLMGCGNGGKCELIKSCDTTKEIYNAATNTCACDTAKHWTGTAGSCTCDTGYVLLNGACVAKATCDANKEIYNAATNTCACNTAAHWTGAAGACTCDSGYVQIGGKCELIKSCDTTKEIYNAATNTCACDTAKHWTGTAGSCTCDSSSVLMDGACVAKMICIVVDSTKDSANCGSCGNVCEAGFECVNSTCKRIADLSTATITCNAKTVKPYTDRDNCAGCNIACSNTTSCHAGVCDDAWVVGDIISFGHYEQDNNTTNGKEPITWRVLDIKARKLLLISEKALDVQPYNTTYISITWEKSTIRSWLNGYAASYNTVGTSFTSGNFIDAAFTADEKAKIVPSSATTDKIFLLSITEANNYFKDNADRMADATRYAVKKGAYVHGSSSGNYTSDGTCTDVHCSSYWWLRSPGYITDFAACVSTGGSVDYFGSHVLNDSYAVRPALWVNL